MGPSRFARRPEPSAPGRTSLVLTALVLGVVLGTSTSATAQQPEASPPEVASLARACPDEAPDPPFPDVDVGDTHGRAIACLVAYGITQGRDLDGYAPDGTVTRGQLATFVTPLVRTAGAPLPAPGPSSFQDLDASVHADSAEALAAAGILRGVTATTFAPDRPVRRDQLATFLTGVLGYLDVGSPAGPSGTSFTDVAVDNVHRPSIARMAQLGVVQGRSATTYEPGASVTRAQMASFVLRAADLLAVDGRVEAPFAHRDAVVAPTTRVLDDAARGALRDVGDDGTLTFDAPPSGLAVGDVVVAEPTAAAPAGLLRRIVDVQGERIATAPARLTDAVRAGHVRGRRDVDGGDVVTQATPIAEIDVSWPTAGTLRLDLGEGVNLGPGVTAHGSVELRLRTDVEVSIGRRLDGTSHLARAGVLTTARQVADLEVRATSDSSPDRQRRLYEATLTPQVLTIGDVPVVVSPRIEVVLSMDGTVSAGTAFAATQELDATAGAVSTAASDWAMLATASADADADEPTLDSPTDTSLEVELNSGIGIFDAAEITSRLTSRLDAIADPDAVPAWTLYRAIAAEVDVRDDNALLGDTDGVRARMVGPPRVVAQAPPPPTPSPIRVTDGWVRAPGDGEVHGSGGSIVRYTVEIADDLATRVDLEEFTRFVDARLGEPRRGWTSRGTVRLQRVDDPARARIRVLLARPATVDRLCGQVGLRTGGIYSCWNGRFAALNADRWFHGVGHVSDLGLYRTYLVNHEVGHGLGFGHRACPGPGRTAPVMMQLSKSTYGCVPNPHPYP